MEPFVFVMVLAAAALHAGWNSVVKVGRDRFSSITLIAVAAGAVSTLALPAVGVPRTEAWPWLLASVALHIGYNFFLIEAYRSGDLGQVYPIARGAAPLLVSLVAIGLLGERLDPAAVGGLLILVAGICLMALGGGRPLVKLQGSAVAYALGTSVFIASYTLTDGVGSRLSGTPQGYVVWLFMADGVLMLATLLARRGRSGLAALRPLWWSGLAGGAMSLLAYGIVIWAMTRAPIALVSALRETSVLFAALISVVVLREPLTVWRSVAGLVIVAGIAIARA